MARKTRVSIQSELKAWGIPFDENLKYPELCDLYKEKVPKKDLPSRPATEDEQRTQSIHCEKGFSVKIIEIAREAGFTFEQINKFTDEEALKVFVIRAKPGLAKRFIERPPQPKPAETEPQFEDAVDAFDVNVLAGGPMRQRVANEQRDIDIQIQRRGIRNITSITVERIMKADERNRVHSTVTVKYKKEK